MMDLTEADGFHLQNAIHDIREIVPPMLVSMLVFLEASAWFSTQVEADLHRQVFFDSADP